MIPALLMSPLARSVGAVVAVTLITSGVWLHGRHSGYNASELEHQAALADALQRQQSLIDAANERGNELAADLAKTQQQLQQVSKEYLTYANAITGNCPRDLGVLVHAASSGKPVPTTPSKPAGPPASAEADGIAAQLVAANVAENYTRFAACYQQLNALIDWNAGVEKAMREASK